MSHYGHSNIYTFDTVLGIFDQLDLPFSTRYRGSKILVSSGKELIIISNKAVHAVEEEIKIVQESE